MILSHTSHLSAMNTRIMYTVLISCVSATCPVHLILLDLIFFIMFGEDPHCAVFLNFNIVFVAQSDRPCSALIYTLVEFIYSSVLI